VEGGVSTGCWCVGVGWLLVNKGKTRDLIKRKVSPDFSLLTHPIGHCATPKQSQTRSRHAPMPSLCQVLPNQAGSWPTSQELEEEVCMPAILRTPGPYWPRSRPPSGSLPCPARGVSTGRTGRGEDSSGWSR
jgi:hypothetical protein